MSKVVKDEYGVKLKYPERSCSICKCNPCFDGIDKCSSDFAKYGCIYYFDGSSSKASGSRN